MVTPEEALEIVLAAARPLKTIRKPLGEAVGHCLARAERADRDQPPTDRSAMDGYAVRASDLGACPRELRLVGEVAAGDSARPMVRPGTCVRILTGAPVPPGADAVVKVESTQEVGGIVTFLSPVPAGAEIRRRGEETRRGEVVLPAGTPLGPAEAGLAASVGKAVVTVHARPRPIVLCTGKELRDAGERVGPHELRDSNGPALAAALAQAGFDNVPHRIVPDDPAVLAEALASAAAEHDALIVTGGVSVGQYDYVPEAVGRIRAKVRFHGVTMKPGRPQLYATLPRNRHIFGLPGNPVSVLTGFHAIVLPALRRMSGLPADRCRPMLRLPLAAAVRAKGRNRTEFTLARLVADGGRSAVEPIDSAGSADLVAAAAADGNILVPREVREIPAGQVVDFLPWRPLA